MSSRTVSMPSSPIVGRREPRLSTAPLRPLTPETSAGFSVIDFARDILGEPLLPWQEEAVIRALELREDGTYRFRTILILVARQNGKTHLIRVLCLWRLFVDQARLILSTSQNLDIAKESWKGGDMTIGDVPALAAHHVKTITGNNDPHILLTGYRRWKISATSRSAGRGLAAVDMVVMDELREQRDFEAWGALSKTTQANPDGQVVCISNAGDDKSVLLNHIRDVALGGEDDSICILEWSAVDGCDLDDPEAWAQANPGLGYTVPVQSIRSSLGTDPPAVFRTEVLCQRVETLDSAIPMDAWNACADPAGSMESVRSRVVACVDVAPDGQHATLVVAGALPDGKVRLDVVAAWDSTAEMRKALPDLLARVKPRALGWFPGGPAAAVSTDLRHMRGASELKAGEIPAICQGLAEQAVSRRILHQDDPLLNAQVVGAARLNSADGWRFSRRGGGHCDAVYAAAGALHLVRSRPSSGKPWIVAAP